MTEDKPFINFKLWLLQNEWMERLEALHFDYHGYPPQEEIDNLVIELNNKFGNV